MKERSRPALCWSERACRRPAAARSLPHAIVARAKLVLWAAQGENNSAIAQRLGWSMPRRWASGADASSSSG